MPINSLFQLITLKELYGEEWSRACKVLLMPDLFNYMLTGNMAAEETILSTTQLFDLKERKMSREILKRFSIEESLFPPVVKAGTVAGNTRKGRIEALKGLDVDVISVCGHDTASAVLLTDAFRNPDCLFLSCGTWSLLGGLTEQAVISTEGFEHSLTNELGYGSRNLFFKNITGLYLLEKFRKQLGERLGRTPRYDEITAFVQNDWEDCRLIDIEEPVFGDEDVDARKAIDAYLLRTGQGLPREEMGYFKIIYQSLVETYDKTVKAIEAVCTKKYNRLHIIGGGAKSPLLCEMIARRLSLPVTAGPYEATALGNIITQLVALGEVESMEEGLESAWKRPAYAGTEPWRICKRRKGKGHQCFSRKQQTVSQPGRKNR